MIYFPAHLKYAEVDVTEVEGHQHHVKTSIKTDDWRLSITLSFVVLIHLSVISLSRRTFHSHCDSIFVLFVTFLLLVPQTHDASQISAWATFLGVSSAGTYIIYFNISYTNDKRCLVLTSVQYTPQLYHTWHSKLVGALSIPMMLIQTPGAVLMVLSIALRPGTNWTSNATLYFPLL